MGNHLKYTLSFFIGNIHMSKITKFFNSPIQSIHDTLLKRLPVSIETKASISDTFLQLNLLHQSRTPVDEPTIYIIGFAGWKEAMNSYYKNYNLVFFSRKISKQHFTKTYRWQILQNKENSQIFIWGYKVPNFLLEFIDEYDINSRFVEDGFIRSIGLGAARVPPLSLAMDSQAPYFDANKETDIEKLLNTYECNSTILKRADTLINSIVENKISKYNHTKSTNIHNIYGDKSKRRILVIGQVEDDASIKYGCDKDFSNNDLVQLAVAENPDAQVFYKVHPDVLNGYRDYRSSPDAVRDICTVLTDDIPLADALESIDHVYTITSLSGLEALLRGIKVTTIGAPFYSGWGLTDDRQFIERRKRKRTLNELVAICYIVYPTYFDAYSGDKAEVEDVLQHIINLKNSQSIIQQSLKPKYDSLSKGIYQHYTGDLYQILHIATHSETDEELVVYQALYDRYDIWILPLKTFNEPVVYNGLEKSRFTLIQQTY